jgi:hypothetical protein
MAKKQRQKHPGGRPTAYEERFNTMAEVFLSKGGQTNELADLFGVNESTIYQWKKDYPEFSKFIQKGRDAYGVNVAEKKLQQRIEGFTYKEKKITKDKNGSRMEITERYALPDVNAIKFYLNHVGGNRWKEQAEELQDQEVTFNINVKDKRD